MTRNEKSLQALFSNTVIKSGYFKYDVMIKMKDGNEYHDVYEAHDRTELAETIDYDYPHMDSFTVMATKDISEEYGEPFFNSRRPIKSSKETFEMESYITGRDHATDFLGFSCTVTKNGDRFEWSDVQSYYDDEDFEDPNTGSRIYGVYDNQEEFLEDVEYFLNSEQGQDEMREQYEKAKEEGYVTSSRRPIKSEYEDEDDSEVTEFYVSLGECGYDGTITVTKEEDGKWHGEDGAVFMGYLTPEEVVEWYDKDYGCAWLCNSRRPIKSGYAPYYNDSTISEKGKKAYEWLCDFVGQELKLTSHPWYGPCVYLNVNKMNITQDMLEEINNKMYEMDGYNSISADSGSWGYGDVYIVTFDQIREE